MKDYEPTQEQFDKDMASWTMEALRDDGLYRHLRFRLSGGGFRWFDIVTWPDRLVMLDPGVWPCHKAADMLRRLQAENERLRASLHSMEMQALDLASENSILKRQEQAELEARKPLPPADMTPAQHVNALVGDGLTAQKVEAICERGPYDVTGVVLSLPDGRACIVNLSAVRWFSGAGDFRALMHGDPVAEERAACAKLCMDKAHKMEREAVDAEKEGDGTIRDGNRATAWVLAVCSQEILARGKPA